MMIAIVVMGIVIIALLVERYFFTKTMMAQLHDYQLANMSRNTDQYIAAKVTEKAVDKQFTEPDGKPLEEATDEEFINAIKN